MVEEAYNQYPLKINISINIKINIQVNIFINIQNQNQINTLTKLQINIPILILSDCKKPIFKSMFLFIVIDTGCSGEVG